MKRVGMFFIAVVFCFTLSYSECLAQKFDLKMMSGPMDGAWYPLGGAIANAIEKSIPGATVSIIPGGGVVNLEGLGAGKCEIGFSNSCTVADAFNGRPPFKKKMENMRQLANLYPQYFQIVVMKDSGIHSISDFKGKTLAPGPKGQFGEILIQQVLEVYGLSYKDLAKIQFVSYSDGVGLMKDGHTDIFSIGTACPASTILDLAAGRAIRLLSLPDDKIKALQKINAGYLKRVIPVNTYPGVDYEVSGIGYFTSLAISAGLPEDLVYKIAKTLVANLPSFGEVVKDMKKTTPKDLALDIGVPLHPGAQKYFKEIGVL
jgi:uncharacterized protein